MRDFKNNKKNNFNRDDHRSDRRNFKNEKPARVRDRGYKNDEEDDEYLSNLIIGRNPVLEALKSDKQIDKVFVDDNSHNLRPCEGIERLTCLLAGWGNIAIGESGMSAEEIIKFFTVTKK